MVSVSDPDGNFAEWIMGASLFVTLCVAGLGYLRRRPIVPASTATELRAQVADLRQENADLRHRNTDLRDDNSRLRDALHDALERAEFWEDRWRRLQQREDKGGC